MVDINLLRPGMRVKIIDAWPGEIGQAQSGEMDMWLGKCMTVRRTDVHAYFNAGYEPCVKMVEDQNELSGDGWYWSSEMIDYICNDDDRVPEEELSIDLDLLFS